MRIICIWIIHSNLLPMNNEAVNLLETLVMRETYMRLTVTLLSEWHFDVIVSKRITRHRSVR